MWSLYVYDDDTGHWTKIHDTLPDAMTAFDVFPYETEVKNV